MNNTNKSAILLSGGLDSLVSLGVAKEDYNIELAITFDYGQRTVQKEIEASKNITKYYKIDHKIIELPWLQEITNTSLVNKSERLPELKTNQLDDPELTDDSAKRVWVPNRNGIFLNAAAGFADSRELTHIIFGANIEEAATFPDNSETFIKKINASFEYSTLVKPKVIAPLAKLTKTETVKLAVEKKIPLSLLRSCYTDEAFHCGECESCLRLKRALNNAVGNTDLVKFIS